MRYLLTFLVVSVLLIFITSCEYKEVKLDAKSYCDCKTREYNGQANPGECPKMLQSFKNKYEYLPEQQELLVLKIADCMGETDLDE
jgi:hypothetical protein